MESGETDWYELTEAALLALLEGSDEAILVFDRVGRCRMIGRRVGELFGIDPGEHVGKSHAEMLAILARACGFAGELPEAAAPYDPLAPASAPVEVELPAPSPRAVQWSSRPIAHEGRPFGRVTIVREVARDLGHPRSNLTTARRFQEEHEREHARSARAWDSYAVLRVDAAGMMSEVTACLARYRREYDVAALVDGGELAVLLPGADSVGARAVATRLVGAAQAACVGGAVWVPPSGGRPDDVMFAAGSALERARAQGPKSIVIDD